VTLLGPRTTAFEGLTSDPDLDPMPDMLFNQGFSGLQVLLETGKGALAAEALRRQPMDAEAFINYREPKEGRTALHIAAARGLAGMIPVLAEAGADLEARNKAGDTALHVAMETKNAALVTALLDAGADVNARRDGRGPTPLHMAIEAKNLPFVELLLERGASVEARTPWPGDEGLNAYHLAASSTPAIMQALLAHPGHDAVHEFARVDKHEASPLCIAAAAGDKAMTQLLLDFGCDINARDGHGETPLFYILEKRASREATLPMIKFLIERGADFDKLTNYWNETPLFPAIRNSFGEAVEILMALGADPNQRSELDETPLLLAAATYDAKTVALLLDAGADIEARNRIGRTPLHIAAHGNRLAVVDLLLKSGADPFAKDKKGHTPDDICQSDLQKSVRALILRQQQEDEMLQSNSRQSNNRAGFAARRAQSRQGFHKNHSFKPSGNRR